MPLTASNAMGTASSGAHPLAKAAPSTAHAFIPSAAFFPIAFPLPPAQAKPFLRNRQLSSRQGGALLSFPPAACGIFTLDFSGYDLSGVRNSRGRNPDQRDSLAGSGEPERQQ